MKVGIVGLGYRMEYLAGLFTDLVPGFRLVGYVDPTPAGLPGLRRRGIATGPAYESIEALTKAEAPDLLMIGSPNHMHLRAHPPRARARPQGLLRKAGRDYGGGDAGARSGS